MEKEKANILIIYTGGTIGMVQDPVSGALVPFDLESLLSYAPELSRINCDLDLNSFSEPIDSSDMNPTGWVKIANTVYSNYTKYDGFVVLHGTDTMAYTASALSFMLNNLAKPVIFTGSQLPIGMSRTDARENLIAAVEIAAFMERGIAKVPEVAVYFEDQLLRGNRSHKHNSEHFEAFESVNFPKLASVGIRIQFYPDFILKPLDQPLELLPKLNTNVATLKVFPGLQPDVFQAIIKIKGLKGLILETYGSGNAFTEDWFLDGLESAIEGGLIIVNTTQCEAGSVDMGRYQTSSRLSKMGMWSAMDMTFEAALCKLMFVLGNEDRFEDLQKAYESPICGELTLG